MKQIMFVLALGFGSLAFANPCMENPTGPECQQYCQMNPYGIGCPTPAHMGNLIRNACDTDPYGAECAELCMAEPENPSCPIDE